MQTPTRNILDNPEQHLRYLRNLVNEFITIRDAAIPTLINELAAIPPQQNIYELLQGRGQEVLPLLNINPQVATIGSNEALVAPTTTDDSTKGYARFSPWINTTGPTLYICLDPAPGAAVWLNVSSGGGGGAVSSVFGRTGAVIAASGDYAAFYQALSADLTAIAALSGTGFLQRTGPGTWSLASLPTGDHLEVTKTAGAALGGHRAVKVDTVTGNAVYADYTDIHEAEIVLGITNNSASIGNPVTVYLAGEMTEPSWSWTPGLPIYLGATGLLTQTPTTTSSVTQLGVAQTATTITIRIEETIFF